MAYRFFSTRCFLLKCHTSQNTLHIELIDLGSLRLNEKSHSSKISLRKVALNKHNLYFSFLLKKYCCTLFYRLLSIIEQNRVSFCCTFAVLFILEGSQALILLHFLTQRLHRREQQNIPYCSRIGHQHT